MGELFDGRIYVVKLFQSERNKYMLFTFTTTCSLWEKVYLMFIIVLQNQKTIIGVLFFIEGHFLKYVLFVLQFNSYTFTRLYTGI